MTGIPPRRIAIISEHASPLALVGGVDSGGQNVYVAQTACRLAREGHQVDVFTRRDAPDQPEVVEHQGYRVVHVDAGPPSFVRKEDLLPLIPEFTERVAAFAAQQPELYDVSHANFWMSGMVAAELKRRFDIPFVITFHALGKVRRQHQGDRDEFPPEREHIEEMLVVQADRVIAECPQDEVDLLSLYNADPARVAIVPCGYDPTECHPVDRAEARRRLGLPSDAPIVLQLGRLVPRKGADNVVRAFSRIRRCVPDALLVIAGGETDDPDPEATPEIARLMEVADAEDVREACHFVGRRPRAELKEWYAAADLFVTTPWYEPFGITPVEAMACGTPVIGSRVGGIQYTVADGVTGLLVPPRDPDALGEAAARLLLDEGERRRMGANAVRRAGDLFTWDGVVEALQEVYERVVQEQASPLRSARDQRQIVDRGFDDLVETLITNRSRLLAETVLVARLLSSCFAQGRKVLVCGNGGSASDAQHFAAELVSRYRSTQRRALPVIVLGADMASLTAWSNDIGYETAFARQVDAFGTAGDVLLGLSTSGRSPNVARAFERARSRGMHTVGLLGGDGGHLLPLSSASVVVPTCDTQRIQEVHGLLIHLICELIERDFDPAEAVADAARQVPA